jgi:hypothetical protein
MIEIGDLVILKPRVRFFKWIKEGVYANQVIGIHREFVFIMTGLERCDAVYNYKCYLAHPVTLNSLGYVYIPQHIDAVLTKVKDKMNEEDSVWSP